MPYVNKANYLKIVSPPQKGSFIPSEAQQDFFDWVTEGSGNCILEAVAGAGKTTTILEGIGRMNGRVWFGVYNKKMADEIKEKISERPELQNRPFPHQMLSTKTFHGEGFGIICRYNTKDVKTDVDAKKVDKIIDRLIVKKEQEVMKARDDLREIKGAVCGIVSMAKNRGIGCLTPADDYHAWTQMIEKFDLDSSLPDDINMASVINFSRVVLNESNIDTTTVDFDDMVYLPLLKNMKVYPFDWVLVDEAQDTNPTRRALAKKLLKRTGRFVAVGDPHQAIFGFTGADNDSLEQIKMDFNATSMPLTVTYRCPKKVVAHAQQWVKHITAHESAPTGEVLKMPYGELIDSVKKMDTSFHGETAILCRYNKYLVSLCFKLIREGVAAKIEGRAIGDNLLKLATRWKSVKTLNGLETKLNQYMEREVDKAMAKDQEDKADRIVDQVETLLVIMKRARSLNLDRVSELKDMVDELFSDSVGKKGLLTLCSAHKSKGLEWNTVFILGREEFMPSKFAKQPWQVAQEINLIYVAVTRAKQTLIEVSNVVEEKVDD